MHMETGHLDPMRRVGNWPEHIHVMGQVHGLKPRRPSLWSVVVSTCMLCLQGPAHERGLGEGTLLPELSLVTKIFKSSMSVA